MPRRFIANNISSSFDVRSTITTDNFFPMKPLLKERGFAQKDDLIYLSKIKTYLNTHAGLSTGADVNLSTMLDQSALRLKDPFAPKSWRSRS
jgi:hypothetical protein